MIDGVLSINMLRIDVFYCVILIFYDVQKVLEFRRQHVDLIRVAGYIIVGFGKVVTEPFYLYF